MGDKKFIKYPPAHLGSIWNAECGMNLLLFDIIYMCGILVLDFLIFNIRADL